MSVIQRYPYTYLYILNINNFHKRKACARERK